MRSAWWMRSSVPSGKRKGSRPVKICMLGEEIMSEKVSYRVKAQRFGGKLSAMVLPNRGIIWMGDFDSARYLAV